jgi:hypothetical protein
MELPPLRAHPQRTRSLKRVAEASWPQPTLRIAVEAGCRLVEERVAEVEVSPSIRSPHR